MTSLLFLSGQHNAAEHYLMESESSLLATSSITLLTILDSSVESSTTTPACLEVVRAYTCNYIYPKCDPATGNYQGVCTDDCIKYVLSDNCRAIFDTLAAIAETSGEITFTRQCNNTLINLERYMPGFAYNPEDCFNISGERYVHNSSPGYCYSINIASKILLHCTYTHNLFPLSFSYTSLVLLPPSRLTWKHYIFSKNSYNCNRTAFSGCNNISFAHPCCSCPTDMHLYQEKEKECHAKECHATFPVTCWSESTVENFI